MHVGWRQQRHVGRRRTARLCSCAAALTRALVTLANCGGHVDLSTLLLHVRLLLCSWAFYLCGGLKVLYDLLLLWSFHSMRAEHETH